LIFTSKNWDASSSLFFFAISDDFFKQLRHQRRFDDLFDIIWAILETLITRSDLRENRDAQWRTANTVEVLVEIFSRLDEDSPDFWTEKIIKTSLDLMVAAAKFQYRVLCELIRFVKIISRLPQVLLQKDVMETLSKVCHQHGGNLLHTLISGPIAVGELFAAIRLLFNAGCDPNGINKDGNTPLHCLAQLDERYWFSDLDIIAHLLLDFGAQLSIKNADGKTAVDLRRQKNGRHRSSNEDKAQGIIGWKLPDWCTELPTLSCLSARVIRRNRIPYLKLPASLISIVEKHKITE